jgi:hypothetical protein
MQNLKYPIGEFNSPAELSADQIQAWLADFISLPAEFRRTAKQIESAGKLEISYRPESWTARQVIHHLADSHVNSYIRFKLALTEDNPTIRPYDEVAWAELPDNKLPIDVSLDLLANLHQRLGKLLVTLSSEQWQRTFIHPATGSTTTLAHNIGMYAWHGRHHLGHLLLVRTEG